MRKLYYYSCTQATKTRKFCLTRPTFTLIKAPYGLEEIRELSQRTTAGLEIYSVSHHSVLINHELSTRRLHLLVTQCLRCRPQDRLGWFPSQTHVGAFPFSQQLSQAIREFLEIHISLMYL